MKSRIGWIQTLFYCLVILIVLPQTSTCFTLRPNSLSREDVKELLEEGQIQNVQNENPNESQNQTRANRMGEGDITLISFLQTAVKKYGEKKVAASVYELAQKSLYDLTWMLAGDLEPWLILDLYKMYNTATADPKVLSVYERFRAGKVNRTIVPEVFALDKKYNEYDWWRRVRGRMLNSVDKYIAGNLKISNPPPKVEFTPDGKPIIAGKPENLLKPVVVQTVPTTIATTTTTVSTKEPDDDDEDEDNEDSDIAEKPEKTVTQRTTKRPSASDPEDDEEDSEDSDLLELFSNI